MKVFKTLVVFALVIFCTQLRAQEAEIKSVKNIYNREDQSRLKMALEANKFRLLLDQSKLNIESELNAQQILQLAGAGQIPAFQPGRLKRTETDTEIRVLSKDELPDQFTLGGTVYHKITLELGEENGKQVITEAYASGTSSEDIASAASTLNFQWSSLGLDKKCKNPVCMEVKELPDGKEICLVIKCKD